MRKAPPTSGWAFAFPGLLTDTVPPMGGNNTWDTNLPLPIDRYEKKIFTFGGGGTTWGDAVYAKLEAMLPRAKALGWDGVAYDWEMTGTDHTTAGFNKLLAATQQAGLLCLVTTTAEGPYSWQAPDKDATGVDWSSVDFLAPQLYGASGDDYAAKDLASYVAFWKQASTGPVKNVHGVTFRGPPAAKFLWALNADPASAHYVAPATVAAMWPGTRGYVLWAFEIGKF